LVLAFMTANTAEVQARCVPLAGLTEAMAGTHGEHPAVQGVSGGNLLVVYASPVGAWTVFIIRPADHACAVAAGKGWTTITVPP